MKTERKEWEEEKEISKQLSDWITRKKIKNRKETQKKPADSVSYC